MVDCRSCRGWEKPQTRTTGAWPAGRGYGVCVWNPGWITRPVGEGCEIGRPSTTFEVEMFRFAKEARERKRKRRAEDGRE